MARNGIYLARAREQIAQQRAENEREHRRRVDDAYRRVPGLRALDQTLQQQMIALVGLTMRHGSDPTEELRALERANLDTQAQRAELLTAYHLPVDYTDDIYTCPRCHDTGYVQGQPCECLLRRYNAELTRDLSRLLQHGDESFEHFDLTLYDENARPKMERVFQVCRSFAQTFRPGTMNLLLQGGTGLGKTYLSACIARVVAGAGYAVAYETAASAFDAFECAKFQRGSADGEAAAQRVEQYLGCDLMILDDLGTEMITAYSTSALYTLINTRLTRAKATIISTSCRKNTRRRSCRASRANTRRSRSWGGTSGRSKRSAKHESARDHRAPPPARRERQPDGTRLCEVPAARLPPGRHQGQQAAHQGMGLLLHQQRPLRPRPDHRGQQLHGARLHLPAQPRRGVGDHEKPDEGFHERQGLPAREQ